MSASQGREGAAMAIHGRILRGQSVASDARDAAREFHAAVAQPEAALILFFCSAAYDLDALGDEIRHLFAGLHVIGCTTAGEIGPSGCTDRGISGASFPADRFAASSGLIGCLRQFEPAQAETLVQDTLQKLEFSHLGAPEGHVFALMLVDGLSEREEPVAAALQRALGAIPLVGGSAGDNLKFVRTWVYWGGRFHDDGAVVVLIATLLRFRTFVTQHFAPTDEFMVVTGADAEHRIVTEIDGLPAAEAYARLAGTDVEHLDASSFAGSPVMVMINGSEYVRSIRRANPDGSLTFYCAIEEGLVLRIGRGQDLVGNLKRTLAGIREALGEPQLIIGCDCILRRVEMDRDGTTDGVGAVYRDNRVVGFNSYGEQYRGLHVNQTFTGVAIGAPPSRDSDG